MPNGWFGQRRNPLDLFGGGTMPYLSAPGGHPGPVAAVAAPVPRKITSLQRLLKYPSRPKREEPAPIGWKRRLAGAAAAFAAGFGGGTGAGLAVGKQITGAPRRAQEARYQRGLEEWEEGRRGELEAYTLEGEEQRRGQQTAEEARKAEEFASPAAVAGRTTVPVPRRAPPTTRVMGTETKQYNRETGEWETVGPAPVYPDREPQRHPSMLEQWLATQMAGLAQLQNDLVPDEEVIKREKQRILEQYNRMAPSYGKGPLTELPGGAGQQGDQPSEDDVLGIR